MKTKIFNRQNSILISEIIILVKSDFFNQFPMTVRELDRNSNLFIRIDFHLFFSFSPRRKLGSLLRSKTNLTLKRLEKLVKVILLVQVSGKISGLDSRVI